MNLLHNRRIHLDSSVYIAYVKGETIPAHGGISRVDLAELIFDASEAGLVSVSTSTITIVEVRRGTDSVSVSEQSRIRMIDSLFDRSLTRFVDLDRGIALMARRIANRYSISTMDAVQVASAEAAGCDEYFSGITVFSVNSRLLPCQG